MPDLLQSAADWMGAQFLEHAGVAIQYQRGATTIATTAVLDRPAEVATLMTDRDPLTTEHSDLDFVLAADAMAELDLREPIAGDLITVMSGKRGGVYEVLPLEREKCFRRCDAAGNWIRVHAKLIGRLVAAPQ